MSAALFAARMGGFHPAMFLFGILVPLLIVGLVAYGIFELVRARNAGPAAVAATAGSASARALLDERFARGEIDPEEYVQRRTLLDGAVTTPAPVAAAAPAHEAPGHESAAEATTEQPVTDPPA